MSAHGHAYLPIFSHFGFLPPDVLPSCFVPEALEAAAGIGPLGCPEVTGAGASGLAAGPTDFGGGSANIASTSALRQGPLLLVPKCKCAAGTKSASYKLADQSLTICKPEQILSVLSDGMILQFTKIDILQACQ